LEEFDGGHNVPAEVVITEALDALAEVKGGNR
jgi:hypothetical protein